VKHNTPPQTDEELSILMPCLNEAETLANCIQEAQRFLSTSGIKGEVVIADNGSSDGSVELAESLGARVVRVSVRGYGAALYFGSLACRGNYIIMADSDGSYDLEHLASFVEQLRLGKDLVMGNRFRGEIKPGAMPWKNRYIGNPTLSFIGRLLFGSRLGDFHCGIRGYRRDAFMKLNLRTTGMEFASEMAIKAQVMGLNIVEVPTILRPDGRSRPPHLRPWRDGWRHLRFMLLFSPSWLFVYPGIAVTVIFTIVAGLVTAPVGELLGECVRIRAIILSCALVLAGVQSSIFGGFLLVFSMVEGLRPQRASFMRIFDFINLEVGLILGGLVFSAGVVGIILNIVAQGSSALCDSLLVAMVPSVMMMVLGFQVVVSSFFFSVLGMGLRRVPHPFEEIADGR
jgi:hypothetical protein